MEEKSVTGIGINRDASADNANSNTIKMFSMDTVGTTVFTEYFRRSAKESLETLRSIREEAERLFNEVVAERQNVSAEGQATKAWALLEERKENFNYLAKDFSDMVINTERLIHGELGLMDAVDGLFIGNLPPNQRVLYEQEFKSEMHQVNLIFNQINLAFFHLEGAFAKEKEILVNIAMSVEKEEDVLKHHQAALWGYNEYLKHRSTGNQYIIAAMKSLDIFVQAIRKEVMRVRFEQLHNQVKDISLARMQAMEEQKKRLAARRELGDDFDYEDEDEELVLPALPTMQAIDISDETMQVVSKKRQEKLEAEDMDAPVGLDEEDDDKANFSDVDEDFYDEEEGPRSIFPLIMLACIFAGVAYYYFFIKPQ